ncbi:MAG: CDP-diacylglycerol--glycerol-3-phosphate 3-phosphatidyltransferase [Clostridia bacterium]|nr:CDP-diacylglycerol--glycerol-3-phosphate 3-phosphatidyltransferase [Clostridia bacterium]MDD4798299.1 CDP-diacylglycerol--glycerol-3-phosphate 3-phosphatidyltransferase [Clostridia bacterium]
MTLANKITISRILLIPVFLIVLMLPINRADMIAALIFIIASATDGLDGYFARSRGEVTTLGKFLDPLADKLLVSTALIALVGMGRLDAWIVVLIIAREFAVTGLRTLAVKEGVVIAASKLGKIKTVTQIIAVCLLLLQYDPLLTAWLTAGFWHIFAIIMTYIALFFTLYSGYDYFKGCRSFLNGKAE